MVTTFFPERLVSIMLNQQLKRQRVLVAKNNQQLADTASIYVYTIGTASPCQENAYKLGQGLL